MKTPEEWAHKNLPYRSEWVYLIKYIQQDARKDILHEILNLVLDVRASYPSEGVEEICNEIQERLKQL